MQVHVYTHHFSVSGYNRAGYDKLVAFSKNMEELDDRALRMQRSQRGWYSSPVTEVVKRTYVFCRANGREFRFQINLLLAFKATFVDVLNTIEFKEVPLYDPKAHEIKIDVLPGFVAREEDQVPIIDYINAPGVTKVVSLRTGGGKTFCALKSGSDRGGRILISIEPRFFNLWVEALSPTSKKQILNLTDEETLYIQGTKPLIRLIDMAISGDIDDIKVVVISLKTMYQFIENYKLYGDRVRDIYRIAPYELYELLGINTAIKDEMHLSFHMHFIDTLFMHVPKLICLTATLENGSMRDKILEVFIPKDQRAPSSKFVKYIDVYALHYKLKNPDGIKYTNRGSTDYNHGAFEKSIMKNKRTMAGYLRIMTEWVETAYLKKRKPHQRAVIFVDSILMATRVRDHLVKTFPDLTISRYAASTGDVYLEARKASVVVTTIKSFGTGFDLDGLLCTLMTNAVNSSDTNIQVLGRTRELKNDPDSQCEFYYLVCWDIPKHVVYHKNKRVIFHDRVKSHRDVELCFLV